MSRKIWRRRNQLFLGFIGYWKTERFLLKIERKSARLPLGVMPSTGRHSTSIETPCWKTPPNSPRLHLPEPILQNCLSYMVCQPSDPYLSDAEHRTESFPNPD